MSDNVGKIGVLVGLESEIEPNKLDLIGKQLAMHIAATKPKAVKREDLSSDDLERERKILEDQAKETGRPDSIIEKMIEGRMKKFYEEVCLLEQTFVIDGESKISKVIETLSKQEGSSIEIKAFKIFVLGEGIQKKQENFAEEVSAAIGK